MIGTVAQNAGWVSGPMPVGTLRPKATRRDAGLPGATSDDSQGAPFFAKRKPDFERAGFGKGTVSAPAAAARTLDKTVESARRIVPTLEEVREDARARLAEQRDARVRVEQNTANQPAGGPVQQPAANVPDALAQARQLANDISQATAVAQARVTGQQAPSEEPRATVQIKGQVFNYTQAQTGTVGLASVRSLNILV